MGVFRPTRKIYPYMVAQFFIIFHDLACDCTTVTLEGRKSPDGTIGDNLDEVEAYDNELANTERFNLPPGIMKAVLERRQEYYALLPAQYKPMADSGLYGQIMTMPTRY
jgi:hypothetical protein